MSSQKATMRYMMQKGVDGHVSNLIPIIVDTGGSPRLPASSGRTPAAVDLQDLELARRVVMFSSPPINPTRTTLRGNERPLGVFTGPPSYDDPKQASALTGSGQWLESQCSRERYRTDVTLVATKPINLTCVDLATGSPRKSLKAFAVTIVNP
ncbi:uncharacterized protein IL334_003664 [Kwoniella shivajii]|uniref:Uncharacterized protein n=1 Tax=Kwoniella shivajii TaxID=564305 RepID=A0ABZ1CYQ4_9TREE|nr:hypothetical protein IL334_003664 [Kwoniella shivajii]